MPSTYLSPLSVLQDAVKAVPAVKWALGVGGVLAAVALVYMFKLDARVAFVGLVLLFCFMGVLVVFSRASTLRSGAVFWPAMIFTWFVLTMFMATTVSLFTSVFFHGPLDLQEWLTRKTADTAAQPSISAKPECFGMPGESAWIWAGEYHPNTGSFAQGPYVKAVDGGVPAERLQVGQWLELTAVRRTMILDYDRLGTQRALDSPFSLNGNIRYTCREFPLGQRLYIAARALDGPKDTPNVRQLWFRVRTSPPG